VAATLLAVALGSGGCGRKGGSVPGSFSPQGQNGLDDLLLVELVRETSDSITFVPAVHLTVIDGTPANGYRLYRKVGTQGYDPVSRFTAALAGVLDQGYEVYRAVDRDWQANRPVDYLARGSLNGDETPAAPVTNVATLPGAANVDDLVATEFVVHCPDTLASVDSIPRFNWPPVAGATRYLLEIVRSDRRLFLSVLLPPDTSYVYARDPGNYLQLETTELSKSAFTWSVAAIDAQYRVIARSRGARGGDAVFQVKILNDAHVFCTP